MEFSNGSGTTRDVSVGGAYIETAAPLPEDAFIDFSLRFSERVASPTSIHCHGRVLRVEPTTHGVGLAVAIENIDFGIAMDSL